MRQHFETRFKDPRSTRADRFIWDYWHVPGQYTALRTPAYHFFPKKLYDSFHQQLVWWGRRNLGCHDISPPWMSCYIEGCKQQLHGDLPHGPWAFVFSLTPWQKRLFQGGETLLIKEPILSYWQSLAGQKGLEHGDIFDEVEPLFNRLTVFDPRIPHGVKEVRGVHDVLQGRLVIHGWFVEPRPFIEGALLPRELQPVLDDLSGFMNGIFSSGQWPQVQGVLSVRLNIEPQGTVSNVKVLSNSLRDSSSEVETSKMITKVILKVLKRASFSKKKTKSTVTLPLIFQAE